jgi:dipeptidase E
MAKNRQGDIPMILYLTSSPCIDGADRAILNPANGFVQRLTADLPQNPRCLFIASSPEDRPRTCEFGSHMFLAFAEAGMPFSDYRILDGQNSANAAELIEQSDLIILAGGHVPTQNRFFQDIRLQLQGDGTGQARAFADQLAHKA